MFFLLTNITYNALIQIVQNKKITSKKELGLFCDRLVQYFVEICRFSVCKLIMKICGFAICEPELQEFCGIARAE
jgi:hypothetical protein